MQAETSANPLLVDALMVIGPTLGFLPQYVKIVREKSAEGFSLFVCFILLTCNILRLFFWFGKQYDMVLVYQSMLMIVAQLLLLEVCVRVRKTRPLLSDRVVGFWNWDTFMNYVYFLVVFSCGTALLTYAFLNLQIFVEFLGFVALSIESALGMPQMVNNFRSRSASGISVITVTAWLVGDAFKTFYFLVAAAPAQFIMCGVIQLLTDCVLVYQIFAYGNAAVPANRQDKTEL
eukprot:gnl/Hemi2/22871_TR7657_c0_g1_i1.p1 gnl/Hemi2/22871_TR7657_c0_g1~~gnl/Hemi2/22871_TR7657_c0_g1_i1.p1  ORF type:complete len:233 (-),score=69.16 gnl/Hemi2/22871_TR7657_c0_g1_i1:97-795(-)